MIGTTALDICPVCGQYTLDIEGYCHNAYCSEDFNEDDFEEEENAFKYRSLD